MNDGNLPGSLRTYLANVVLGAIAIVFAFDLILPVFLATLVRTDEFTAFGRLGFLGPVLIVADSESRRTLVFAAIGAIASATLTCVLGTLIGLATAGKGGGLFRIFRWLTLLPGRMPAWVIPACFAASFAGRISEIMGDWALTAWVVWTGWWGATRIAAAFAEAVAIVPRVEWDAARNLGRSKAATIRSILAPRLSSNYLRIAKRVVLVTLFDPAPILFMGVGGWPIGEVFGLLRQAEVRSAVEASSWILWLLLIALAVGSIFRLVIGNRAWKLAVGNRSIAGVAGETECGSAPELPWIRGFACLGAWPVVFLAASLANGLSDFRWSNDGLAWNSIRTGVDSVIATSLLNGLLFAVSAAIFVEVLVRIGPHRRTAGIANEIVSWWSLELAICAIAIGGICSTGLSSWLFPNSTGFPWSPFWPIALLVFVIAKLRFPVVERGEPTNIAGFSGYGTNRAAFDSALTLGLSRRRAEALARRADRGRSRVVGWFSVVLAGWWLWISPAWSFVPLWRVASVPVGGQLLGERILADHDPVRFGSAMSLMLATSAVLAIAAGLTRRRTGE